MKFSAKLFTWALLGTLVILLTQSAAAQSEKAPEVIRFAILGDNTGDAIPGIHKAIIEEVVRLHPDFVMTVGDMIEGYSNDTSLLNQQWDDYFALVKPISQPIFYTPGNHDITFDGMLSTYETRVGQPYYSSDWHGLHLIVLDNSRQDVVAEFPEEQLAWLEADLKKNQAANWTAVFMHIPFWYRTLADNKPDKLHDLFTAYGVDAVFTGHFHEYFSGEYDGIRYTSVGSSGGDADETSFGLQYHYTWVTLEKDAVHIAPIKMGSVFPRDVQTADEARARSTVRNKSINFAAPLKIDENLRADSQPFELTVINTVPGLTATGSIEWDVPDGWSIIPQAAEFQLAGSDPIQLNFVATCSGSLYPVPTAKTTLPYSDGKTTDINLTLQCARQVSSRRTSSPPVIDGKVEEPLWAKGVTNLFAPDGTATICDSTEIYFAYDDDNLYVAAYCHESAIDQLAATMTQRDDAVFGEDCFGFMFQPHGGQDTAYQVYINPVGTIYDQKLYAGSDGYWTSNSSVDIVTEVKCLRGDDFWSVEMRVPFDQFDANIKPGDRWRVTFRRKQARLASSAALAVPWEYDPTKFGALVFE